jgi:hypothetical protein
VAIDAWAIHRAERNRVCRFFDERRRHQPNLLLDLSHKSSHNIVANAGSVRVKYWYEPGYGRLKVSVVETVDGGSNTSLPENGLMQKW